MGKINFSFNGIKYSVHEALFSAIKENLKAQFEVLQLTIPKIKFTVEIDYKDYSTEPPERVVAEYEVEEGTTWRQAIEAGIFPSDKIWLVADLYDWIGSEKYQGRPGIATAIGAVYDSDIQAPSHPDDVIESKHYIS